VIELPSCRSGRVDTRSLREIELRTRLPIARVQIS
jgi:hypothetical protein